MALTPKQCNLCSRLCLKDHESGLYPDFLGREGPVEDHRPDRNSALDYLLLLWPELLTSLIASETNRYARQRNCSNWVDIMTEEIWTFFGNIILMDIHRLPRIINYWSKDDFVGVAAVQQSMFQVVVKPKMLVCVI